MLKNILKMLMAHPMSDTNNYLINIIKNLNNMKTSKFDLQTANDFLNQFNIQLIIDNTIYCSGQATCKERVIRINLNYNQTIDKFYSCLLHEFIHILCYDHKKYFNYHGCQVGDPIVRKIGLKAERYVDKVAAKLFKQFFPELTYVYGYKDLSTDEISARDWFHENVLNVWFPKQLVD